MSPESTLVAADRKVDSDRVLHALLRPLVSKRKLGQADLQGALEATFQRLLEAVGAEGVLVCLAGEGSRIHLRDVHVPRLLGAERPASPAKRSGGPGEARPASVAAGQGVTGKAVASLRPLAAAAAAVTEGDAAVGLDIEDDIASLAGFAVRSVMAAPLVLGGRAVGTLTVVNKTGGGLPSAEGFSAADLELLAEVARYAAKAVVKAADPEAELTEEELARFVARLARLEFLEIPEGWRPEPDLLAAAGEDVLRGCCLLPLSRTSARGVKVAMANPFDILARDTFRSKTGLEVEGIVVAPEGAIRKVLAGAFTSARDAAPAEDGRKGFAAGSLLPTEARYEAPVSESEQSDRVIQLANRIIEDACARGASDIHIEPFEYEVKVRYRIDGSLQEAMAFPLELSRALVSRLKIMSRSMDITENRLPQDGRIKFKEFSRTGLDIDLRVSTAPLAYGQKVVMRILDKGATSLGLEKMGFSEWNLRVYREMIQKPYGLVLHVGPTGSGKTTTLYSALSELNRPDVNIQTAEDPIEYMLPNVNQMQMNKEIELTFAAALRCFLRQDPDVILVGEIRDEETAEIAVEAALTGHIIFSTLHTNDAPGTVTRLVDMGIQPFLLSSSLLVVCAQRLMRRLCTKCKVERMPSLYETFALGLQEPERIFGPRPGGCDRCKGTGYKGRIGVHEVMTFNDELKSLISRGATAEELREAAITNGMIPLYKDAMEKVIQGIASIEEALETVRKE
ncbi:MAG: Flp pilus assembly complex ATPase component TadA [Planctomycetes bacterium]|nr:Flp pilus assembly complex ATPase component TadA [Planctomycetota bacterium]